MPSTHSGPDQALVELLKRVDEHPAPAVYAQAARELLALTESLETVKVSLLASFTIEPLVPYLAVEAARNGFAVDVHVGGFNNVVQELISCTSGCLNHRPDIVFNAQHLEDLSPSLVWDFLALGPADVEAEIDRIVSDLRKSLLAFRQHSSAVVVLQNFAPSPCTPRGLCEGPTAGSQTEAIRRLNQAVIEAAVSVPDVHVFDYERLVGEIGLRSWRDEKMWYLGRAPLSTRAMAVLAHRYAAYIRTLRRTARKCLVLDLDGTLWGGILGEVGVSGVALGEDYPGNVFRDFQRIIRHLKHRGVLLALNSKNNLDEVREAFLARPEMLLRLEDFAAIRVNWNHKPANMVEIAQELNIGLDSLVFLDDSAVERDLMRQALPQVLTPELPPTPMQYAEVLRETGAFERLNFTNEDRRRTEMYQEQRARQQLAQSALNLDDFLSSLKMQVTIDTVDHSSLDRVVDLIRKTNQFNLTTRRYSATQLAGMVADPAYGVFFLRMSDRFGDNGIVAVAIVHDKGGVCYLDTFLLSCRVIGRTVETALLAYLVRWARDRRLTGLEGEFIPTAKNAPAADFFARHQFEEVPGEDAPARWRLPLDRGAVEWPRHMIVRA